MTARKASAKSNIPRRNLSFRMRTGDPDPEAGREERRREIWIMAAIAILFVLNVIVYLCHHWDLTGASNALARPPEAPRVYID